MGQASPAQPLSLRGSGGAHGLCCSLSRKRGEQRARWGGFFISGHKLPHWWPIRQSASYPVRHSVDQPSSLGVAPHGATLPPSRRDQTPFQRGCPGVGQFAQPSRPGPCTGRRRLCDASPGGDSGVTAVTQLPIHARECGALGRSGPCGPRLPLSLRHPRSLRRVFTCISLARLLGGQL